MLGHLSLGSWVLMQVLSPWMSALCPQNMLEQLLIHQPEDPIAFLLQHLQQDNDNGERAGGPAPVLGTAVNLPVLPGGQGF